MEDRKQKESGAWWRKEENEDGKQKKKSNKKAIAYISISPAFRLAAFPFAAALRRLDAGPLVLAFLAEWTD